MTIALAAVAGALLSLGALAVLALSTGGVLARRRVIESERTEVCSAFGLAPVDGGAAGEVAWYALTVSAARRGDPEVARALSARIAWLGESGSWFPDRALHALTGCQSPALEGGDGCEAGGPGPRRRAPGCVGARAGRRGAVGAGGGAGQTRGARRPGPPVSQRQSARRLRACGAAPGSATSRRAPPGSSTQATPNQCSAAP